VARLVPAKCPTCGAGLDVPRAAEWVTCGYCHTSSFVDRGRTSQPASVPHGTAVIRIGPTTRWWTWALPALAVVVASAIALTRGGGLRPVALVGRIFLADVNGDGKDDVVTQAVYIGDSNLHLRAIDGTSGHTLWASEPWVKSGEDEVVASVPGALLVLIGGQGVLVDPRTGKSRLTFPLPERANAVCRDGARSLILTRDDRMYALNLETGALEAAGKAPESRLRPACTPAASDIGESHNGALQIFNPGPEYAPASLSLDQVLRQPGEEVELLVGEHSPGSRVPMLAARSGARVLWTSNLPSVNPLNAEEGEPAAVTMAGGRAFAAYLSSDEEVMNVTAFALASGERLWDVALPRIGKVTLANIAANAEHAYVFMSRGNGDALQRLNATDGKLDWRIEY
jgi:outer membrane protein assembly factor BamB